MATTTTITVPPPSAEEGMTDIITIPALARKNTPSPSNRPESFDAITERPPDVTEAEAENDYPTGTTLWLIVLCLSTTLFLGGLDLSIVATAVPTMTDYFHTVADVGWYNAAYRLTMCSFQFMFGKLYKFFPVKRIFLASIAIFLVGSIVCATAVTSHMFVLGRAITGLATAGVIAGCFTIIIQIMPLRKRPMFAGMLSAVECVATIIAPVLGGVLTQKLSWRWCFYINLPIGGLAFIITAVLYKDNRRRPGSEADGLTWKQRVNQLDLVGNLVFVPSITCLFIALSWAGAKYPWSDPRIIALFVVFAILLAVFVLDQIHKGDAAALPPRIVKQRSVVAGFIFSFGTNSVMNVLEYYLPTYFQAVREYSPARSGFMTLPFVVGSLVAMLLCGFGTSMIGYYTPFMLAASTLMPIAAGLMTTFRVDTGLGEVVAYGALAGFACGIGFQAPQSAVQASLPAADDAPLALAIIIFAQNFGPALAVSAAQTIFTNRLAANLRHLAPDLDARTIENLGLSDIKNRVGAHDLGPVLLGFDRSLSQTWYLAVGLACLTMVGSLTMEWRSVKQKRS